MRVHAGYAIATLVLGIVLGIAGVISLSPSQDDSHGSAGTAVETSKTTTIDVEVLEQSMQKNNELSTSKYLYTASVPVTDVNNLAIIGLPDVVLPFTNATYVLETDGTIKAGYNLDDASVSVEDNTVVVSLPKPKILSHEVGEVRVSYEQQNIMNPLKAGEESSWISSKKQEMEERAIELGLYDEAEQNAKATFESLFEAVIPEGAKLEVRFAGNGDDA